MSSYTFDNLKKSDFQKIRTAYRCQCINLRFGFMRQICGIYDENTLCLQFFLNFKRSVNFEARTLLRKLNKC